MRTTSVIMALTARATHVLQWEGQREAKLSRWSKSINLLSVRIRRSETRLLRAWAFHSVNPSNQAVVHGWNNVPGVLVNSTGPVNNQWGTFRFSHPPRTAGSYRLRLRGLTRANGVGDTFQARLWGCRTVSVLTKRA